MRKTIFSILLLFLFAHTHAQVLSDSTVISILTCTPGKELYARYGHTAIRLADPANDVDVVFNYGIFDFNTDAFYWKFVRGETWYQLGLCSTETFIQSYSYEHRDIFEQVLNLNISQKRAFIDALRTNYEPQNRMYLYNFVFDNCATRPYQLLKSVIGDSIRSTYTGSEGKTYRRFIQHYTGRFSLADIGINLIFGQRADQTMSKEQNLFLPEELMFFLSQATYTDGTPVILKERIAHFNRNDVPWYKNALYGLLALWVIVIIISIHDKKRKHISKWIDILFLIVFGLLLSIVFFLTFFSIHPLVGFSYRLILILIMYICARIIVILP